MAVLIRVRDSRVGFTWWRGFPSDDWNVPRQRARVRLQLQCVQVIQISAYTQHAHTQIIISSSSTSINKVYRHPVNDDADDKMILTAPPPENWKRPPGHPHIVAEHHPTTPESLQPHTERSSRSGSKLPLWRLTSMYGTMHS